MVSILCSGSEQMHGTVMPVFKRPGVPFQALALKVWKQGLNCLKTVPAPKKFLCKILEQPWEQEPERRVSSSWAICPLSVFCMASARSIEGAPVPILSLLAQVTSQINGSWRLNLVRQPLELFLAFTYPYWMLKESSSTSSFYQRLHERSDAWLNSKEAKAQAGISGLCLSRGQRCLPTTRGASGSPSPAGEAELLPAHLAGWSGSHFKGLKPSSWESSHVRQRI